MSEPKKRKPRSKANGEGTIYSTTKNGKPYYKATLTIGTDENGKLIRKSFCSYKKQEVIKRMNEYKHKLDNGLLEKNNSYTVETWFHTWLFDFRVHDLKETTFAKYDSLYRNYIKSSEIGSIALSDLRATHLQAYYKNLLDKGIGANIIRTVYNIYR